MALDGHINCPDCDGGGDYYCLSCDNTGKALHVRSKALEELELALKISTDNNSRALAESVMFGICPEKDSPAYFHSRRLLMMVEMENHISMAIDFLSEDIYKANINNDSQ